MIQWIRKNSDIVGWEKWRNYGKTKEWTVCKRNAKKTNEKETWNLLRIADLKVETEAMLCAA